MAGLLTIDSSKYLLGVHALCLCAYFPTSLGSSGSSYSVHLVVSGSAQGPHFSVAHSSWFTGTRVRNFRVHSPFECWANRTSATADRDSPLHPASNTHSPLSTHPCSLLTSHNHHFCSEPGRWHILRLGDHHPLTGFLGGTIGSPRPH